MSLKNKIDNIFLDRDGVINEDYGYVYKWSEFKFIEGSIDALKYLTELKIKLIIVTNQGGIARGYYTEDDFKNLNQKMIDKMNSYGIEILDTFYCPHYRDGIVTSLSIDCECRKPKPGMILKAAKKYELDLSRSIIVGDRESDLIAGKNANLLDSFLINPSSEISYEKEYIDECSRNLSDFVFNYLDK